MTAPALRVLHLFANYKWTGPADPAIRCACWQERCGAEVAFAQAQWTLPGAEHRMARELWNARVPVVAGLELRKHFRPRSVLRDGKQLASRLRRDPFDVVHAHLLGDHLIAALALRGLVDRRPILIRSVYDAVAPRRGWRTWLAFGATDGVVVPSRAVGEQLIARLGVPQDHVLVQDPPTESFRDRYPGDLRGPLGLARDDFVVGITARIQPHRRFELCWDTLALLVQREPRVRFVLLGRGNATDTERLVNQPIRRLGLERHVVLPGYLYEPEYGLALRSFDAFLFLVPGSDGTCRALREATALGIPAVGTGRGLVPHLLGPHPELAALGECGLVAAEDPAALAGALLRLAGDAELRARLGRAGKARAAGPADPRRAALRLLQFAGRLRGGCAGGEG
ncbi:MAG: glycosyltransferase [Planctomycetes bacterium]|nr:glycosyltransferase [Planctomycetota bacterium]